MRGSTTAWALYAMSRPPHLLLIAVVYAMGGAIGVAHGYSPSGFVAGLVALLPVSVSIHHANEYADYDIDAITQRTRFSGGSGALVETGLPRSLALAGASTSLFAGVVVTAWLVLHAQLEPVAVALLASAAFVGWMYSLPPLKLAWRGYGEVTNAVLGGTALPLYGYASVTGTVSPDVVVACVPFTAIVFVNLLETQWPDRRADAAVGKRTLVTRWSKPRLRAAYSAGASVSFSSLILLGLPPLVVCASFVTFPLAVWGRVRYTRRHSPFPAVAAMVVMATVQFAGWSVVAGVV